MTKVGFRTKWCKFFHKRYNTKIIAKSLDPSKTQVYCIRCKKWTKMYKLSKAC